MYRFSTPAWEGHGVPPEVRALAGNGREPGRALDLGCGTGTNSIYLAQQGFTVVGVDFSGKAIELARRKARQAGVAVDFHTGDVTRLDFLNEPFEAVLDVGCFHGLDAVGRARYAAHLARLTRPGSTFLLWAFGPSSHFGVGGVQPEAALEYFAPHFLLSRAEPGTFNGRASSWYWFSRGMVTSSG
jgi:SAM-dependent methyltransferase